MNNKFTDSHHTSGLAACQSSYFSSHHSDKQNKHWMVPKKRCCCSLTVEVVIHLRGGGGVGGVLHRSAAGERCRETVENHFSTKTKQKHTPVNAVYREGRKKVQCSVARHRNLTCWHSVGVAAIHSQKYCCCGWNIRSSCSAATSQPATYCKPSGDADDS